MLYSVGDLVRWRSWSNGKEVDKAGMIHTIVPPKVDPRTLVPQGFFFTTKSEHRLKTSYILSIPRLRILYYPELFWPLEQKDESLLYTQDVPLGLSCSIPVKDMSDRIKLCRAWELVGDEYENRKAFAVNVSARLRVWFWVDPDGVEYVKEVERFRLPSD